MLVDTHVFYIPVIYTNLFVSNLYNADNFFYGDIMIHHFTLELKNILDIPAVNIIIFIFTILDSREFFKFSRIFVLIMNSSLIDFYVKFFRDSK